MPFATQIVPSQEELNVFSLPSIKQFDSSRPIQESRMLMLKPDDSIFIEIKKEAESPMLESSARLGRQSTQPYTSRAYGGQSLSFVEASMMDAIVGNTKTLGLNRNLHEYAVMKIEDEIALARHKRSQ